MDGPQMLDKIVSELLMCRFILDLLMHLEELQQLRITMLVVLRVQHLGNGTTKRSSSSDSSSSSHHRLRRLSIYNI